MSVRRLALLLALLPHAFLAVTSLRAQAPEKQAPEVLPKVDVTARLPPLVKVGEYHLRQERFAAAVVADGDWLYIIGGADALNALLDSIERFNVRTHVSEKWGQLATARCWHRAVRHGRKIYVLGGSAGYRRDGTEDLDPSVEIIDLDTRRVTAGPEMPEGRNQFACALVEGKIYVIGGDHLQGTTRTTTNAVHILDLSTSQWSAGPPMPTARVAFGAVVTGMIVVPGGYNGRRALNVVEAFDPQRQVWRTLPPLSQPTSASSLVFLDHYLFMFGDFDALDQITAYDLKAKTSETYTLKYSSARHTTAVEHDGKIYVVGGKLAFPSALDYIQVYELRKKS